MPPDEDAQRMRPLLLTAVLMSAALADEAQLDSCPILDRDAWAWAALYHGTAGDAIVVSVGKDGDGASSSHLALAPGRRPLPRAVRVTADGVIADGGQEIARFADLALHLVAAVDRPLVARWACAARDDGIDRWFPAVPLPVDPHHPLSERLRALQGRHLAAASAAPDDPREMAIAEPLPSGSWRRSYHSVTEVAWWSDAIVSVLDWMVIYGGGVHHDLNFASHTWLRAHDGTWRDADLLDVFGEDGAWRQQLGDAVARELTRQHAGWYSDAADEVLRPSAERLLATWNLAGDGLVLSFAPYEVGPYAQGPLQVRLPWSALPAVAAAFPAVDVRTDP